MFWLGRHKCTSGAGFASELERSKAQTKMPSNELGIFLCLKKLLLLKVDYVHFAAVDLAFP